MKPVVAFLVFLQICSCTSKVKHRTAPETSKLPRSDTFKLEYSSHLKVPQGVYLDTVNTVDQHSGGKEITILPRLKDRELSSIDRALVSELTKRLLENAAIQIGSGKSVEVNDWTIVTEPVSMYKSDKLISYAFISTYDDALAMRPFRRYISVNYNLQAKKILHLNDYFNIVTQADTAMLSYMIYAAVGEWDNPYWQFNEYDNLIDFAVDEEKLYFYFDQFSAGGNPCGLEGSAKKNYYLNLIRNEYR
jgi:hypothetical protein